MSKTINHGTVVKNSPSITIYFPSPFPEIPTVVITPEWRAQVGAIETITNVSKYSFTLTSGNQASDYKVHWIAIYGE